MEMMDSQIKVLSKGLSFCLSRMVDWFQLELDFAHFFRNLWLKVAMQNFTEFGLSIKYDFNPTVTSNAIDTYVNLVKNDINALRNEVTYSIRYPNITREEIFAPMELSLNDNITIKLADMGGGIVIMDTVKYTQEIDRQLTDDTVYCRLSGDPVWSIKHKIENILKQAIEENIID